MAQRRPRQQPKGNSYPKLRPEFGGAILVYAPWLSILHGNPWNATIITGTPARTHGGAPFSDGQVVVRHNNSGISFPGTQSLDFSKTGISILAIGSMPSNSGSQINSLLNRVDNSSNAGFELDIYNKFAAPNADRIYGGYNKAGVDTNWDRGYVNGVSDSLNGSFTTSNNTRYVIACSADSGPGSNATGDIESGRASSSDSLFDIELVILWKRALTAQQLRNLSVDPYYAFVPQRSFFSMAEPASGGTAVNPGVGSLAITGYAPTIAQPHGVAPGVGSLTLTGYAPTVSQPQAVAPGVGSLTITGYAPTIAQPHAVAPGVGALTITGYAPSIAQPQTAAPGVGALTITGYAPTVAQQAGQSVNPGVGTVAITGFAPAVAQTAHQAVAPGVGSVVITGYAPAVTQASGANAVAPGVGALVITGYAPAVTQTGASTGGGIDPGERTDGYPRGGKRSRNREPDWLKPRNAEALEALQDAIEGEATANAVARATEAADALRAAQERAESQRLLMQSQMDVAAMLGEQMRIAKAQQIQQIQQARADALVLEDEEALAVLLML